MTLQTISINEYLNKKGIVFREQNGELLTRCLFNNCDNDSQTNEMHLYFNAENGQYNCKKCGETGNIVTLARHLGDDTKDIAASSPKITKNNISRKPKFNPVLVEKCHKALPDRIRQYLNARGVRDDLISEYKLGWGKFYGKQWITIPIKDIDGNFAFLKLRQDPDDKNNTIKYKFFPVGSSATIYGWEWLENNEDMIVICEGELDQLVLTNNAIPAITSTAGAGTFKKEWIKYLKKLKKIYICFDKDKAGEKGAGRVIEMLTEYLPEAIIYKTTLPDRMIDGKDITDYFVKYSGNPDEFMYKLSKQMPNSDKKKQIIKTEKEIIGEGKEIINIIASEILSDGTIIEMLFDSKKNETSLAIYKNNEIKIRKSFENDGIILKPHSANKDLLKHKVILFPSEAIEYGSQKELIQEIQTFIHKYLSVSLFFEKISSYYALFSWIYDDFNELPYLRGLGDYGTGKSRFLQVVGSICYRPMFASGATTVSPIFRILNDFKGTLILDEADFQISDTTADIIKILNNGFAKGMSVLRSEGNNKKSFDVKAYNVFSPKIIASRMLYRDTALESRMITEDMNLNSPRKDIPFNIPNSFWDEALKIRNKLLMFRFRNIGKSIIKQELENREIEPRLNQIAIPLMSIIEDYGIIKEIQQYIKEYNEKIKTDRTLGYNYQILEAICEIMNDGYIAEPTIKQITEKFNEDLGDKEKVTPKKMGYLIKKTLDLKTEKTRDGYIISKNNKEKIETLKKRYGIKKIEDVNIVNDVNIDSETKEEETFI